ncbi:sulfotransferase [Lysobacter sp. CFH 32150]|uniref:tetratricopeptide repeat-containing sulfotransferase family protein n=1 Tax=Lysobacter sp. CFH 32150 TaxID=2927128 RepID=UPI001FA7CB9C|nr:sulfotransferase [Lysobacter sp. CFH 32150]MCI4568678.1 sulfotransferase [Lysobacter sp. CFH 32150]
MTDRGNSDWQRAQHYFALGNFPEASAACESLLASNPHEPSAHWLLATIDLEVGDFLSALAHTREAARHTEGLPPHQVTAITRLLISVGDFEEAFHTLMGLDTSSGGDLALLPIGEQLIMLEQHGEALRFLDLAAERGVRHPMLSFLRSNALKFTGNFPAATEAAEDTIAQQPNFAHAHWSLAHLSPKDGAGNRIDRIRKAMASFPAPLSSADRNAAFLRSTRAVLCYALFKELDTLDDTEAAWRALSEAMELKRLHIPYVAQAEDAMFDRLVSTYSEEFTSATPAYADGPTPIFIVGMPRTGTTLLERIVGNHSQVTTCGELNELQLLFKRTIGYYCPEFMDETSAARLASADAETLGKAYLRATAWRTRGKPWFIDKHQSNFLLAGLIMKSIPQAKIIHLRREPMDSCFSNLKELFSPHAYTYSYDLPDVANHYRNYSRLMRHLSRVAPGRILDVNYEDLARSPSSEVPRILQFCDLPFEDGITDIASNTNPVATASSTQVREAIHGRNIGGWKRYARQLTSLEQGLADSAL